MIIKFGDLLKLPSVIRNELEIRSNIKAHKIANNLLNSFTETSSQNLKEKPTSKVSTKDMKIKEGSNWGGGGW